MNQDKEDDVAVGAARYREPGALGTHAPSFSDRKKPYRDAPPEPWVDEKEWPRWSFWRAGIAEFLSSLLFLYITIQTVMGSKRKADPCLGVGSQGIAWAFGGMIFVLVYCTAGISGGHINPAITFALFLARKVSFNRALYYIVCQCLGAICGAGIVKGFQPNFYQAAGGGANSVKHGYTKGDGLGAEIVGTFLLVYVVFSATDAKRKARDSHVPALVPLPIGFAVYLVHLATIPITGTGINPARSLGAAVIFNTQHNAWADHWIFWVGPLIGAALAAGYYQLVIRALPFRKTQTPAQTSASNSARASVQNPADFSVQNSAQNSAQTAAMASAQNSAQTSAQTAAQASGQNSDQTSTQTWQRTQEQPSEQTSTQSWQRTQEQPSEQTSTQSWQRTQEQPSEQTSTQTWQRTQEQPSEQTSTQTWQRTQEQPSEQTSTQTWQRIQEQPSEQTSTQTWQQTWEQPSEQTSTQTWQRTQEQPSEQTSTQTWQRTWEQPSEQTSTQTWEQTWEESSEPSSKHLKRQYSVEML